MKILTKRKVILPKINVPKKYQPYEEIIKKKEQIKTPIICPIIIGIGIITIIILIYIKYW